MSIVSGALLVLMNKKYLQGLPKQLYRRFKNR
jgi:hypothetical protein